MKVPLLGCFRPETIGLFTCANDSDTPSMNPGAVTGDLVQRHLKWGWWSLLAFVSLGITLEVLHGFKIGAYLSAANQTRRLMWTLAHAHGVGLALLHLGFAATVGLLKTAPASHLTASRCLRLASLLIPGGFFLGGLSPYAGDPGLGIILVPPGALLLFGAAWLTAKSISSRALPDEIEPTASESGKVP